MSLRVQLSAREIAAILRALNPGVFDLSTEEGMKAAARYWRAVDKLSARLKRLQRMQMAKLKRVEREKRRG